MIRNLNTHIARYKANFSIAVNGLLSNKIRSILTALGVIFGVGAVISMLAIGSGARQEVIQQMEMVGVNNIIVEAETEESEREDGNDNGNEGERKKYSPGLRLSDGESLVEIIPNIRRISPEIYFDMPIIFEDNHIDGRLAGVQSDFFDIHNLELQSGEVFNHHQAREGKPVCIIGHKLQGRLFGGRDPVGEYLKAGDKWLKVIGVMMPRYVDESMQEDLGVMDYGTDVFVPVQTALMRHKDRGDIMQEALGRGSSDENYHQIDRLVIQADKTENLENVASVAKRALERRHNEVEDFSMSIPELLLRQEQQTRNIFNLVLGAIAGISLLVGGIGIMNIMLASVWERIREIGLRKAVGATKRDIISQFVFEAVLISLIGGLLGIGLGIGLAHAISYLAGIATVITFFSIGIAFFVSVLVGIVFGIAPARRAAMQDPITSLRHE